MRARVLIVALAMLCPPMLVAAQESPLQLPAFEHLRAKAKESVDITIGAWPLRIVAWMTDEEDPEDAEVKEVLMGLKGVYVRSYEFDKDFAYSRDDVEAVRQQLTQPGWRSLLQVRNRDEQSAVDVYVALENGKAKALALVASEPRQFTILHIVGSIDMDKLDKLQGHLGVPRLNIAQASVHTESR